LISSSSKRDSGEVLVLEVVAEEVVMDESDAIDDC
jgi:hypothetical protein